jgi:hypothetical protein
MNWFKKRGASAAEPLVNAIGGAAFRGAGAIRGAIDERFVTDEKQAMLKSLSANHEFLAFFMHHVSRLGVSRLGQPKYRKVQKLIGPVVGIVRRKPRRSLA